MLESIPNDPSNFGPDSGRIPDDCQKCQNPECEYFVEPGHLTAIGSGLFVCSQCLEDLPRCENCDQQGGTPKQWPETDPGCGYSAMVHGCSLCGGGR